jgi:hypothetical protein
MLAATTGFSHLSFQRPSPKINLTYFCFTLFCLRCQEEILNFCLTLMAKNGKIKGQNLLKNIKPKNQ